MKNIYSPLVHNNYAFEIEVFDSQQIISKYKNLGLNVSRFFNEDSFSLYECKKTGYRFFYPPTTIGDAKFYEELSKSRINYYSERWEHIESLKFLNPGDEVLEVGSGFGRFLTMMKAVGARSKGLELNSHAVNICKKQGLDVENVLIEDFSHFSKGFFDVICSFQVLEHVYEVQSFLEHQIKLIKPGGRLIIGVPNNNPFLFINDKYHTLNLPPHHAGLWNKKSLKSLEKIFPLKLEKLMVEPLECSYNDFIMQQKRNKNNRILKKIIGVAQKFSPSILRKVTCSFFSGRNILAVYKKV